MQERKDKRKVDEIGEAAPNGAGAKKQKIP
jgi:hypothetical protein